MGVALVPEAPSDSELGGTVGFAPAATAGAVAAAAAALSAWLLRALSPFRGVTNGHLFLRSCCCSGLLSIFILTGWWW